MTFSAPVSASVTDLLQRAGGADAAAKGCVHVVSVDPIRTAVGERWTRHEGLIEDFVIRSFRRGARDDDFIVRVNETDFILIQPSREPISALSRASQLARETLNYFLGAVETEKISISIVDRLGADGVDATRVTEAELSAAADVRWRDLSTSDDGSPPWERFGVARPPRKVVTIRRPGGGDIQAVFFLDPVWNVGGGAVVSFVARTVAVQAGSDGAFEAIDPDDLTPRTHAVLALKRLQFIRELATGDAEGPRIAVHAPISVNCLSYSATRTDILAELKRMVPIWRERLFIEIDDAPPAMPGVRLSEIAAQLRPFCRAVQIHLTDVGTGLSRWDRCGITGVILTRDASTPEKVAIAQLEKFVAEAGRIGMTASFYGAQTRSLVMAACASGVTFLSGDCVVEHFGETVVAQRFNISDLYR